MTRARHERIFSEVIQMLYHRKAEFCHIEIKTCIFSFFPFFVSFFFFLDFDLMCCFIVCCAVRIHSETRFSLCYDYFIYLRINGGAFAFIL